jgi:hypothetical protein
MANVTSASSSNSGRLAAGLGGTFARSQREPSRVSRRFNLFDPVAGVSSAQEVREGECRFAYVCRRFVFSTCGSQS